MLSLFVYCSLRLVCPSLFLAEVQTVLSEPMAWLEYDKYVENCGAKITAKDSFLDFDPFLEKIGVVFLFDQHHPP